MAVAKSIHPTVLHFGGASALVVFIGSLAVGAKQWLGAGWRFAMVGMCLGVACFLFGFAWRIARWMRASVPFRITLTVGQQRSLRTVSHDSFGNPHTAFEVWGRVLLDVFLLRPLWRATPTASRLPGKLQGYRGRWLWLFAVAFHSSLAVVVVRHLRFFLTSVPSFVALIQRLDVASELTLPKVHVTSLLLLVSVGILIARRLAVPRLRAISLAADYFPLLLLAAIAVTGLVMRHVTQIDQVAVKAIITMLPAAHVAWPSSIDTLLLVHLTLVSTLAATFPLSKLMHFPGALMSPTLTLANNSRAVRHIDVHNPEVQVLHYAEYEAVFRERMIEAGLPVEEP